MNPKRTTTPGRTQRLRLCTAPARAYLYAKEAHARSTSINALRYLLRLALVSGSFPLAADAMQRDWAIGPVPQTVIDGDQPGRAPLGVIVGARRLLTGEIVVADASAVDLRRFVRTITRRGRGPGEMTNVASLSRSNRAITAIGGMDVVAIGPDATTPVRYALPSSGGPPSGSILGVFGSGQVLLGESRFRILSPPSRVVRDTTRLVIASLADVFQNRVEHVVDHEAAADEKVVHAAVHRQFEGLLHLGKTHFVGVKEYDEFLFAACFGFEEIGINAIQSDG